MVKNMIRMVYNLKYSPLNEEILTLVYLFWPPPPLLYMFSRGNMFVWPFILRRRVQRAMYECSGVKYFCSIWQLKDYCCRNFLCRVVANRWEVGYSGFFLNWGCYESFNYLSFLTNDRWDSIKYIPLLSHSYKNKIQCGKKQSALSWAETIPPAIVHTRAIKFEGG